MNDLWKAEVGRRPIVVHIQERPGRKTLWLRWWDKRKQNWSWGPTTIQLRDDRGRVIKARVAEALAIAEDKRNELASGVPPVVSGDHLLLMDGLREVIDAKRGLYPVATQHRREVERAITFAVAELGNQPWVAITPQDVQQLWRAKIRELVNAGHPGHRQSEVLIVRLLTVAKWLAANKRIPHGTCTPPHKWREQLRSDWRQITGSTRDPEVRRPRHTIAQVRRILEESPKVDPRLHLMLWLGLELRLGQVVRARRSDLDLEAGTFTVHGIGKKKGTVVVLTDGQLRAVKEALAGYLAAMEAAGGDYPLFPSGQLKGGRKMESPRCEQHHRHARPIGPTARHKWLREAETLAGLSHQPGRGLYGLKRAAVDEAVKDLDEDALRRFGGWTDTQMPRQVYKDQQDVLADQRASQARARVRGETVAMTVASEDSEDSVAAVSA